MSDTPAKQLGPGDDLEMIQSPWLWPYSVVLPMKNRTREDPVLGGQLLGIIIAGHPKVILLGTLGLTDWSTAPRIEYASVEALLADSWIVD